MIGILPWMGRTMMYPLLIIKEDEFTVRSERDKIGECPHYIGIKYGASHLTDNKGVHFKGAARNGSIVAIERFDGVDSIKSYVDDTAHVGSCVVEEPKHITELHTHLLEPEVRDGSVETAFGAITG